MLSIYNYEKPQQFLLDVLAKKQAEDPKHSVRKWAKVMGLPAHNLLVMLLQGRRPVRLRHAEFLAKGLDLTEEEEVYFKTLIQYDNAAELEDKAHIRTLLRELSPGKDFQSTYIDEYEVISDWIHMAILAMGELRDFTFDEKHVVHRLKGRASIPEIRGALLRLKKLNLLAEKEGIYQLTHQRVTTRNDVANAGARKYHGQVLGLAREALQDDDLSMREFQSFTMAIAKDKIPLAKKIIRETVAKLIRETSGEGDEVFQTSIQFFRLTTSNEKSPLSNQIH